jgi:hypothetical protein
MRCLRRLLHAIGLLLVVAIISIAVLAASIELGCRPSVRSVAQQDTAATDAGYHRDGSRTFFTFPEWYIVYAAEDLGNFVATHDDSGFDYFRSIAGFWKSYCAVKKASPTPPPNDVTVMIYTIGVSFTVEYGIKGIYENTIGRVTEWWRGPALTDEDKFSHRVALDYAKFLYKLPWFKYPFWSKLTELWTDVPRTGRKMGRKWERRFALSLEYGVKAGYGALIQKVMDASGDEDVREIMFEVRDLTPEDLAAEPRLKKVRDLGGGLTMVRSPRYQEFTEIVIALSRAGRVIPEIAGNHAILVTVIASPDAPAPAGLVEAISMPLAAKPGTRRIGYVVQVDKLVDVVHELDRNHIPIEHLFDY